MRTTLTCLLGAATLALAGCGDAADAERASRLPASAAASTSTTTRDIDRDARTIEYEGRDGETALELLRDAGYDVTTESSDLGEYVTAIGDVASTRSRYWTFTVDGELPNVGADAYETADGDAIQWRFGS